MQKLIMDDFYEEDYQLVAIHSSIESYRLAFLINKYFGLNLSRSPRDITFKFSEYTAVFPLYACDDEFSYSSFYLIKNQYKTSYVEKTSLNELFSQEIVEQSLREWIIPEHKKVDYFLKIETENQDLFDKPITTKLLDIPQITASYVIDYTELKSKNNLIFD